MVEKFEYNGHKFLISLRSAEHLQTKEKGYFAYVSKDGNPENAVRIGTEPIFFADKLGAITNAKNLIRKEEDKEK